MESSHGNRISAATSSSSTYFSTETTSTSFSSTFAPSPSTSTYRFPIHSILESLTLSTPKVAPPVCETDDPSSGSVRTQDGNATAERRRKEKTSWSYVLRSGLAGGIAGCAVSKQRSRRGLARMARRRREGQGSARRSYIVFLSMAKTAIAPLDRVKILFQAQNPEFQKYSGRWLGVFTAASDIVKTQGLPALFQGHSATLLRIFPYAAIKYMAYDKLHFLFMPTPDMETSSRLFIAGASSGVLSVFLTYPLELIRVRLAFETKRKRQSGSLNRIIRTIYTEGATEAPFSGDARKRTGRSNPISNPTTYNPNPSPSPSPSPSSTTSSHPTPTQLKSSPLSTSAIQSLAIAQGATSTSPVPHNPNPSTVKITTNRLLERFPILKFYRGFSVTVIGMIPYAGTSFLVFGRMKTWLQTLIPPEEEVSKTSLSFLRSKTSVDLTAGALAGAISQTAAYPFEVVRRRQQVGGIIRPSSMLGVKETVGWIWKTSGWRGFYVGLSIGFLKVVPMTSISFAVWLSMKRQMGI